MMKSGFQGARLTTSQLTSNHIYTSKKLQNTPDSFGNDFITNFVAQLSFKEIETTFIKAMSH